MAQAGVVSPQRKLNHLLSDHHPSNGQMFSLDPDRSNDDAGPPLTPKYIEPAGCKPSSHTVSDLELLYLAILFIIGLHNM